MTAEGIGRDMKTLPVGSRPDYRRHPKGHAEFFGQLYPRRLIDNEVEAYSDELARVNWEMCDKRRVWSNSCREITGRNCARSYVLD